MTTFKKFRTLVGSAIREEGQDLAEYALLLIFVVVVAVAAVVTLGDTVIEVYWGQASDMFGM